MRPKYKLGSKIKMLISECEAQLVITNIRYDDMKATFMYTVNGRNQCGQRFHETLPEEFLMENVYV